MSPTSEPPHPTCSLHSQVDLSPRGRGDTQWLTAWCHVPAARLAAAVYVFNLAFALRKRRSACMPATYPEEAKNFRLLGHDPSAAWGGGSLVQVHKGHAYVGAVGGSSYNGPEGFTVHDVRDPTKPHK